MDLTHRRHELLPLEGTSSFTTRLFTCLVFYRLMWICIDLLVFLCVKLSAPFARQHKNGNVHVCATNGSRALLSIINCLSPLTDISPWLSTFQQANTTPSYLSASSVARASSIVCLPFYLTCQSIQIQSVCLCPRGTKGATQPNQLLSTLIWESTF